MSVLIWDAYTRKIVNEDGSIRVDLVQLSYDQYDTISFQWKTSESGTLAAKDVSAAVSWSASINIEYNDSATVMARTLNADIDSTDADTGILLIPIDSYTATWLSQLGTSGVKSGKLEVIGRNITAQGIYKAIVDINCENAIDPAGGTPPQPTSNYYTKSEADAKFGTNSEYDTNFTNSDLVNGILTVTHNLGQPIVSVTVMDENNEIKNPTVIIVDEDSLTIDLSGWGVISESWTVMCLAKGGIEGMANPMTAAGDMIIGGALGAPTALAVGDEGDVLTIVDGVPAYAPPTGGGGGMWDLVERWTSVANETTKTFSNLDGDTDVRYKIVAHIVGGGSTADDFIIKINNASSTYITGITEWWNNTTSGLSKNTFYLAQFSANSVLSDSTIELMAKTGQNRTWKGSTAAYNASTLYFHDDFFGVWTDSSTNITSLVFLAPGNRYFAAGSYVELWKLAQ